MASPVALPAIRAAAPPAPTPRTETAPASHSAPERANAPRLMIEEIGNTGIFIYKVLDAMTGKVIAQIPREDVVRLSQTGDYTSGVVVDAQA